MKTTDLPYAMIWVGTNVPLESDMIPYLVKV